MKITYSLLCLALLIQSCQGQNPAESIAQGEKELNAGNAKAAVNYFDAALGQTPNSKRALVMRSKAKYQLKDYAGAVADSEAALSSPKDGTEQSSHDEYTALWNLAILFNTTREFTKARSYFDKLKALDPDDARLYENVGYSYLEEKNYDQALAQFQRQVQIDPQAKRGFYALGKANLLSGNFKQAVRAYDEAIKLDALYATAYENRAAAKYQLQDIAGCCADLQKCKELGVTQILPFMQQVCK